MTREDDTTRAAVKKAIHDARFEWVGGSDAEWDYLLGDAVLAAVYSQPWLINAVQAMHAWACLDGLCTPKCRAVPEAVRVAAGIQP